MPFFSSFTGSFSGGRRIPSIGIGGGGGAATYSLDGATQSATTQLSSGALVYLNYNADGTEVTTTYNLGKQLYTVALPTPYDPTSGVANYDSGDPYEVVNITAGNLAGFRYNNDGTKAFFTHQYANSFPDPTSGHISEFSLSTAYDIFSISSSPNALYDVTGDWYGSNSFNITDINFNTDGSKMFITNGGGLSALGIFEYDLGTEFDLSTATYSQGFDFATDMPADILPRFGTFNSAGTKFYMADIREEYVYEFDLSTGFDVSTMSYNGVFLDISGIDTGLRQVGLSQDETQLYVTGAQNLRIYTFDLVQDAGFGGGGGGYDYSSLTVSQTIQPADIAERDRFGISVDQNYDGTRALIASYNSTSDLGQIYSYTRSGSTWTQEAKFTSSDNQANDQLWNLALNADGDTAIVGAYGEDTNGNEAGAAYIFTRSGSTWTQQTKLQASNPSANDRFGIDVAINQDGNTVIVGSQYEDTDASNSGAAYVFTRSGSTWTQETMLKASDAKIDDWFGNSVALSSDGNTAIVGSSGNDITSPAVTAAGAAYVFTRSGSTWTQEAKIRPADISSTVRFGHSVVISADGNTAAMSAIYDDTNDVDSGAVYVYTRSGSTWTQEAKIVDPDPASLHLNGQNFVMGRELSMTDDGNTLLISDWHNTATLNNVGSVYTFTRSGGVWTEQSNILSPNLQAGGYFQVVSISGDGSNILVGAYAEDLPDINTGAVYAYQGSA